MSVTKESMTTPVFSVMTLLGPSAGGGAGAGAGVIRRCICIAALHQKRRISGCAILLSPPYHLADGYTRAGHYCFHTVHQY